VAALAGAEAELTFPCRREQQAALVETPAAEHPPHLEAVDSAERILGVDADLILGLAHNPQITPASGPSARSEVSLATVVATARISSRAIQLLARAELPSRFGAKIGPTGSGSPSTGPQ
jgi:hypothetical protein